jgi:hypothetical protein
VHPNIATGVYFDVKLDDLPESSVVSTRQWKDEKAKRTKIREER